MSNLDPTTDPADTGPAIDTGTAAPADGSPLPEAPPEGWMETLAAELNDRETRRFGEGSAAMQNEASLPGEMSGSGEAGVDPATLDDPNTPPGGWPTDTSAGQRATGSGTAIDAIEQLRAADEPAPDPEPVQDVAPEAPVAGDGPAAGAQPEPEVEQPTPVVDEAPAPTSGYTFAYTDPANPTRTVEAHIDDATVHRALGLASWAENLDPVIREAMGAIETGQAVAVPRAEVEQFLAWRNQQQAASRDADLANLDIDEDVAKIIAQQRDQIAALQQAQAQAPAAAQPVPPQMDAELTALATAYDTGMQEYATTNGLSDAEVRQLSAIAEQSGVIGQIMDAESTFNPVTGQRLQRGDARVVAQRSLEWALAQNAELFSRVVAHRSTAITAPVAPAPSPAPPAPTPAPVQPLPTPPVAAAADQRVNDKRSRAASLASAPSAAVTPAPRVPLADADRVGAMAAELAQAMGQGG